MSKSKIKLGSKVRCKITGFEGIAIARTEFINGCVQYSIASKVREDNKLEDDMGIDETSLEVIREKKPKIKKSDNGGATRVASSMRGY